MVSDPAAGGLTAPDPRDLAALGRLADRLFAERPGRLHGAAPRRHAAGAGAEFLDFQDYAPGADARAIDWRASARLDAPVIRRRHDESSAEWFVCLDRSASMASGGGTKWRLARELAAAFLFVLLRRGHAAGILAFSAGLDAICPPGRGEAQLRRGFTFLDRLAVRVAGGASRLAACAPLLVPCRSVIVVSDFLAEDGLARDVDALLAAGGAVQALRIFDANDAPALPDGPVLVRDVETGQARTVLGGGDAARATAAELRALGERIAAACLERSVPLTECRTEESWMASAVSHLRRLSPGRA